ncbi:hypothetical protein YDYSY3_16310 [Paenibacillus chitinolyticus]|uniref:hypothetical protein n=1 Tax=Paenibacillus chitinolyticus TaxID=79263 RepID=UPI0026E4D498|nr:hypothetical protein [Paenibacillus chitinolyticus]GKS10631.1 hypothetical protein YDYSY3_16310 [Paenibacillus chitinolyticus]
MNVIRYTLFPVPLFTQEGIMFQLSYDYLRTLMKWNLSVLGLWIEGGNLANY